MELLYTILVIPEETIGHTSGIAVSPKVVGTVLFSETYLLAVELASVLLLAALVGAYHLGRRYMRSRREEL